MSLSQGNSSSRDLSHMAHKPDGILVLQNRNYSTIPAALRKEHHRGRATKSWGALLRSVLRAHSSASGGDTVLSANTRGRRSTKIQLLAGKEQQASSLGLRVYGHALVAQ